MVMNTCAMANVRCRLAAALWQGSSLHPEQALNGTGYENILKFVAVPTQ